MEQFENERIEKNRKYFFYKQLVLIDVQLHWVNLASSFLF